MHRTPKLFSESASFLLAKTAKGIGRAERLKAKLAEKYQNAHIMIYDSGDRIYYRVRVGRCQNLNMTAEYEEVLKKDGYTNVFTVAE